LACVSGFRLRAFTQAGALEAVGEHVDQRGDQPSGGGGRDTSDEPGNLFSGPGHRLADDLILSAGKVKVHRTARRAAFRDDVVEPCREYPSGLGQVPRCVQEPRPGSSPLRPMTETIDRSSYFSKVVAIGCQVRPVTRMFSVPAGRPGELDKLSQTSRPRWKPPRGEDPGRSQFRALAAPARSALARMSCPPGGVSIALLGR